MAFTVLEREEAIARVTRPITPEERIKAEELLDQQAKAHNTTSFDVLHTLELPVSLRKDVIQGFISAGWTDLDPEVMRKTLKMEEGPFGHHYADVKARKIREDTKRIA